MKKKLCLYVAMRFVKRAIVLPNFLHSIISSASIRKSVQILTFEPGMNPKNAHVKVENDLALP